MGCEGIQRLCSSQTGSCLSRSMHLQSHVNPWGDGALVKSSTPLGLAETPVFFGLQPAQIRAERAPQKLSAVWLTSLGKHAQSQQQAKDYSAGEVGKWMEKWPNVNPVVNTNCVLEAVTTEGMGRTRLRSEWMFPPRGFPVVSSQASTWAAKEEGVEGVSSCLLCWCKTNIPKSGTWRGKLQSASKQGK